MLNIFTIMIGAILMSSLVVFILVNIIVGCDSWDNTECVTPKEFIELML